MDQTNVGRVALAQPLTFSGEHRWEFIEGMDGVHFMQGRSFGVRVVFDNSRPSLIIPWHNIKYAEESSVE